MKTAKFTLMFLACAAAIPGFAQNTTDSRCGMTNFDASRNLYTIVSPTPGLLNQQCFITVVAKQSWRGGMPDAKTSEFVEGNYEITLSGGGAGGGGGIERVGGGDGGAGAAPVTAVRYLQPGTYRVTIGAGGQGGVPNGGKGGDGAPTSLSNANSNETIAGFAGAEAWNGRYSYQVASTARDSGESRLNAQLDGSGGQVAGDLYNGGRGGRLHHHPHGQDGGKLVTVASSGEPGTGGTDLAGHRIRHEVGGGGGGGAGYGNGGSGGSAAEDGKKRVGAQGGDIGAGGGGGAGGEGVADAGAPGGNGFIRIALQDAPPQAQIIQPAPSYVAPVETPAPVREPRRDRN